MNKIKIIYIIHNLGIGGAQRVVLDLAKNIDKNKYEVTIISLVNDFYLVSAFPENYSHIKFYTCNAPRIIGVPWIKIYVVRELYRIIKKIKPQIVHSHLWSCEGLNIILFPFLFRKVSWVHTIHTSGAYFVDNSLRDKILRNIEIGVQKIGRFKTVAISDEVFTMAKDRFKLRDVSLIYNGVDISLYKKLDVHRSDYGFSENDIILIFCSRYNIAKGHLELLIALSMLIKDYTNLKLVLVGDEIEEHLSGEVSTRGLKNNVVFMGARNDIPDLLSLADIGVFPSHFEGMPVAFLEMMSVGLPIVATDISVIQKITDKGTAALLTPVNQPEKLAYQIKILLEDEQLRIALGMRAKEIVHSKYTLNIQVLKHEILYSDLC